MLPGNVAINEAIEQRLRSKSVFSLAYINLNHFKQFNDLYGYASGDSVIKLLANVTVQACENSANFVGHIGGDDFMVVFDQSNAVHICNTIIEQFELQSRTFLRLSTLRAKVIGLQIVREKSNLYLYLRYQLALWLPIYKNVKTAIKLQHWQQMLKEAKRYRHSYLFICKRRKPAPAVVHLATDNKHVV